MLQKWYVLNTKPRCERIVCARLERRDIEVFFPRMEVRRTKKVAIPGRVIEPVFPGYIFVRVGLEENLLYGLRWTPGVRRILGYEGRPTAVPDEVVDLLKKRMEREGFVRPRTKFVWGDRVQIKDGPLKGLIGVIEEARPGKERVKILMSMLRASAKVEIHVDELEKVSGI